MQPKNLSSTDSDSKTSLKVAKSTDDNSFALPLKETKAVDREQQTIGATPLLDPSLIATIHANKGAIETIRGQIIELRHDVDRLRVQIKNRKRSTTNNDNSPHMTLNQGSSHNIRAVSSPPSMANNVHHVTKSNPNSVSQGSVSHHHHHHHHIEQSGTTGRSSVCAII